jgi:hypothetical protein
MAGGYTRAVVERMLPALWDRDAAVHGLRNPMKPDADMPKGYVNPKKGSPFLAHLVDIRAGWERAPLSREERQAMYLRYGLDYSVKEAGIVLGCRHQRVSERCERGVGKLAAYLNGEPYVDGYDYLPQDAAA